MMMTRALGVALALWIRQLPGTLVDRVVAVIDKEVITASELLSEARVALVWRQGDESAAAQLTNDADGELLKALRDYVVNQTLIAAQARRMGTADVSDDDLQRRLSQFKQRFGSIPQYAAFLRRCGISEAALQDILRRDLGNERTLAQRIRQRLSVPTTEEERTSQRTRQERYEAAVKQWLDELRQGVEIRLLGPDGELEVQGRS